MPSSPSVRGFLQFFGELRLRRGDEFTGGVAHDGDEMVVAVGEDREAGRLFLVGLSERWHQRDAHFLAWNERRFREGVVRSFDHGAHLPRVGTGVAEDFSEGIRGSDRDDDDFAAFEIICRIVRCFGAFENIGGVGALRRLGFRLPGDLFRQRRHGR